MRTFARRSHIRSAGTGRGMARRGACVRACVRASVRECAPLHADHSSGGGHASAPLLERSTECQQVHVSHDPDLLRKAGRGRVRARACSVITQFTTKKKCVCVRHHMCRARLCVRVGVRACVHVRARACVLQASVLQGSAWVRVHHHMLNPRWMISTQYLKRKR